MSEEKGKNNDVLRYKYYGMNVWVEKIGKKYYSSINQIDGGIKNIEEIPPGNSLEEANQIVKKFINDHQWQEIDTKDNFLLRVRHWWDGKFGYCVGFCSTKSDSGFSSFEEAKKAGEKVRNKMIIKLEEEVAVGIRRSQLKKERPDLFE